MGGELFLFGGTDRRDMGDIVLGGGLVGGTPPNLPSPKFLALLSESALATFLF